MTIRELAWWHLVHAVLFLMVAVGLIGFKQDIARHDQQLEELRNQVELLVDAAE